MDTLNLPAIVHWGISKAEEDWCWWQVRLVLSQQLWLPWSTIIEYNAALYYLWTVEDPIGICLRTDKSVIHQRQVGEDTKELCQCPQSCLGRTWLPRWRDATWETIQLAISVAETTGHWYLARCIQVPVSGTADRMVDVFPPEQQQQIQASSCLTLVAVFSQTSCLKKIQTGWVWSSNGEIMIVTPAIANWSEKENRSNLLMIQTGGKLAMQTFGEGLADMYKRKHLFEMAMSKMSADELQRSHWW